MRGAVVCSYDRQSLSPFDSLRFLRVMLMLYSVLGFLLSMIDSHCHLTAPQFDADRDGVIARAIAAGISPMFTISDDMSDLQKCFDLAQKFEHIFYTIGVHPHHASSFDRQKDLQKIRKAAVEKKCRGIGEIGLDYHSTRPLEADSLMASPFPHSLQQIQQRVFEAQLTLAKELDLPAVIHCREAVEDVWTIVKHVGIRKPVIHCCTERWEDIKRFVDLGCLLSFTGIITYPKSEEVRETVKHCPLSQMMIETDAPFLAPVLHRGKRCEPMHVVEVAKKIAEIKGISMEEVDRATTANAVEFFGL